MTLPMTDFTPEESNCTESISGSMLLSKSESPGHTQCTFHISLTWSEMSPETHILPFPGTTNSCRQRGPLGGRGFASGLCWCKIPASPREVLPASPKPQWCVLQPCPLPSLWHKLDLKLESNQNSASFLPMGTLIPCLIQHIAA